MAVLAPEDGARDVVAQEGLALPCAGAVEHFRLESLGLEQADVLQQLLEGRLAAAHVHQAGVVVAELEAAAAQILHEVAAAAAEVAQGAHAAQHPLTAAAAHELEAEARQRGGEARLHVDGPAGPHEPGDPPQQRRRGERDAVAGRDETGVAVGGLGAERRARFQHDDVGTSLCEIVGRGHADRAAPDDHDIRLALHALLSHSPSDRGTDSISRIVYGSCGWSSTESTGPASTTLPWCST